jgi:hypothetical protein
MPASVAPAKNVDAAMHELAEHRCSPARFLLLHLLAFDSGHACIRLRNASDRREVDENISGTFTMCQFVQRFPASAAALSDAS